MLQRFRNTCASACSRPSRTGDPERGASLTEAVMWAAVAAALIVTLIALLEGWATTVINNLPTG